MKCKDYINTISKYDNFDSLNHLEKEHYLHCEECKAKTDSYFSLFKVIEKEKNLKVNPFISTNIIAKIEGNSSIQTFKSVILNYAAVIVFSIFLGGLTALFIADNIPQYSENEIVSQYFENDADDFYVENSWLNMNFYNLDNN